MDGFCLLGRAVIETLSLSVWWPFTDRRIIKSAATRNKFVYVSLFNLLVRDFES